MSGIRLLSCAALALAGIACDRAPTSPEPGNLTGAWGGEGIQVTATRAEVRIRLVCEAAEFSAPLRVGSNGRFALPGTRDRTFSGGYFGAFGEVTGEELEVTIVRWSAFEVRSQTYVAQRDAPPNLDGVCAASG